MNSSESREATKQKRMRYGKLALAVLLASPFSLMAQNYHPGHAPEPAPDETTPVQIVALDECDPKTFNDPAALGADFCKNVTIGAFTTLNDLFAKAAAGTPDPGWDFEPDVLRIKKGTPIIVVDQGGEPHTFTEVKQFGGGFIEGLNAGEETVSECQDGFKNLEVARTRILQGSQLQVNGLSKGEHRFQCCIHPWMRVKVQVQDSQK